MKVLIQDAEPNRLAAWLSQVNRPGRICHLANTTDQARFMLMHDPYDLVMLEISPVRASTEELMRIAQERNPDCKVIELPEEVGVDAMVAPSDGQQRSGPALEDADTKAMAIAQGGGTQVQWRSFRSTKGTVVTEASGVTWRSFRQQVTTPDAADAAQPDTAPTHQRTSMRPRIHLRSPDSVMKSLSVGLALRQRGEAIG